MENYRVGLSTAKKVNYGESLDGESNEDQVRLVDKAVVESSPYGVMTGFVCLIIIFIFVVFLLKQRRENQSAIEQNEEKRENINEHLLYRESEEMRRNA